MNNLLVLGCSYSHLGHHIQYGTLDNSYTIQLKEQLGFNKLINLAIPGASPSTINRILLQYLDNPVHGRPDFIFIQWPNANRNEYFLDGVDPKENVSYVIDNELVHLEWSEDSFPGFANSTWASTTNNVDKSLINAHSKLYINTAQQLINLYKEVGIAEQYLGNLKIPYAYVESDELLCKDHYNISAFNYAQHLCHKQFFIPNNGIQRNSSTYANDDYKDGHPGANSHKKFAEAIIPKLKELI
jgi:hypothetical protein